jgi:hypothetical protein
VKERLADEKQEFQRPESQGITQTDDDKQNWDHVNEQKYGPM